MIFDPTFLLLVPGLIMALWAQSKTASAFRRWSGRTSRLGITVEQVALDILRSYGVTHVRIEPTPGHLSDHYDPSAGVLRLSESVWGSRSIAALGVAAHEAGHAIQHARGYWPISLRNLFVPVANLGSALSMPLFFMGLFFGATWGWLMDLGILLFAAVVLFHLITLPVEFDASRRAEKALLGGGYLTREELTGVKDVLGAAGLTYLAAALSSLLGLLRLILLSRSRD